MKRAMVFALQLALAASAQASQFAALRYDDNFSAQPADSDWYTAIKHIDLGEPDRYLSFGGDLRERFEYFSNSNIGSHPATYESLLMHRLLLHLDAHWDWLRTFVQIGNYEENGREPRPKPTDIDHLDIRQAFIDIDIPIAQNTVTLRGGRQELAFGASRIISARDGPNIRLDFDGAQLLYKNTQWRISVLAVRPADNFPAQFNDSTNRSQALWGVYATYKFLANNGAISDAGNNLAIDAYYFGSTNNDIEFDSIAGREHRATFGARFYGGAGNFDGDTELIVQSGAIGAQRIHAFAWATDSGWTFRNAKWRPRLGLRTDIISGDRSDRDNTLGTFNALYPTGSYFSEASVLAQANLLDFAASISIKPIARLTLTWSINPLWRYSTADALYSLPLTPLIPGDTSTARYIGTQNQLVGIWQYNNYLSFKAALVKFESGTFVQKGGGHNLDYAQFATSIRF